MTDPTNNRHTTVNGTRREKEERERPDSQAQGRGCGKREWDAVILNRAAQMVVSQQWHAGRVHEGDESHPPRVRLAATLVLRMGTRLSVLPVLPVLLRAECGVDRLRPEPAKEC